MVANNAIAASERASGKAEEAEKAAKEAIQVFQRLSDDATRKTDELRKAGEAAADKAAQAASEIAALAAFSVKTIIEAAGTLTSLSEQLLSKAEETSKHIDALNNISESQ